MLVFILEFPDMKNDQTQVYYFIFLTVDNYVSLIETKNLIKSEILYLSKTRRHSWNFEILHILPK